MQTYFVFYVVFLCLGETTFFLFFHIVHYVFNICFCIEGVMISIVFEVFRGQDYHRVEVFRYFDPKRLKMPNITLMSSLVTFFIKKHNFLEHKTNNENLT